MKKIITDWNLKEFIEKEVPVLVSEENSIYYTKSGQEALDIHSREKAHLIIAPVDLADMPVERFCAAIREDNELKKVAILLICSGQTTDMEKVMNCGANDYITLPLNPAIFLWKTTRLLSISERTSYRVVVKIGRTINSQTRDFFCASLNISSTGILVETDEILSKGDRITCSFFLPDSIRIVAEGQIARISKKENNLVEYGIKFVDLPRSVESQIDALVEKWQKRKTKYR